MSRTISGGVFDSALSDGRAGVEIELLHSHLCASTADGDAYVISYDECQLEMGGYSGKMLFCRNADRSITLFSEDKHFPKALAEAAGGRLDEQLAKQNAIAKSQSRRSAGLGFGLLLGTAIVLVLVYFGIRAGANRVTQSLPVTLDVELGKAAYSSMPKEGAEISDPDVVQPISAIVERLAEHAKIDGLEFELHVIDSPTVNAYCLPGGTMVVYTGLITAAEAPGQLAAVISHEMAHATLRHGLSRISQTLGLSAAVSLIIGDTAGVLAAAEEFFRSASINSYSRQQETDADLEGVRMLHEAGIDPSGMPSLFELLKHEHGEVPEALVWISTHPDHASRIEETQKMIQSLPKKSYTPLDLDWRALKARVGDEEFNEDSDAEASDVNHLENQSVAEENHGS
ncbi:MAG: M48 family metallopeptidase [Planctomycetota bacterium]|nr:M48 family metallopeptidase [Planctomycetota bacterium]